MEYPKVYPGEQKGTGDTYREQVKEKLKSGRRVREQKSFHVGQPSRFRQWGLIV